MRKKLLSLLTVLCLVLGMLPATAMAAGIAAELGYSEDEVAMYISEDTDLTEDVEGLIIVTAPVKVTIKGAKLTTGLVIAPGAEGAAVTLSENADVNAVIVMAKAEVTVEETAVAETVTVTAPETKVSVAGEVKVVNVAEEAEKTTVSVAETAKVETVTVSAPAAAVEVSGEVASVAVAETAAGAAVTVAETATVKTYEVAAPDVKTEVAGTVESVKVAETATGNELAVTETAKVAEVTDATGELTVSGDGAANVTVTDSTTPAGDTADEEAAGDNSNIDLPPVVIQPEEKTAPAGAPQGNLVTAPIGKDNATNYKLEVSDVTTQYSGDANAVYNVKIHAENVKQTTSGNPPSNGSTGTKANWVGIGIPVSTDGNYAYKFYTLTRWRADATPDNMHDTVFTGMDGDKTVSNIVKSSTLDADGGVLDWTDNGTTYHGVYVPAGQSYPAAVLWSVGVEVYDISSKVATSETLSTTDLEGLVPVWTEIYDIQVEITEFKEGTGEKEEVKTASEEDKDEAPKDENLKEETPKVEAPKDDQPTETQLTSDQPKVENPAPTPDQPAPDQPTE